MKTRLLIIIGIILAILCVALILTYYQEIKLALGLVQTDDKPQPANKNQESTEWEKYITASASRIDKIQLERVQTVSKLDDVSHHDILNQLLAGADGCKNETEICKMLRGISLEKHYSFGVRINDHDEYSITINQRQADELLSSIDWTVDDGWAYTGVQWDAKNYLLMISSSNQTKTPDAKMSIVGTVYDPVDLSPTNTLNYTIQIDTWATYGTDAKIDLVAVNSARDSGIITWVEPETLYVPERSSANTTLFIHAQDDAREGIYDIRVIGHANEKNAGLYCSSTVCPTVNVGKSGWHIRTFGSDTGMGIGSGAFPENTWAEIELNKDVFFEGDTVEINAYIINNSTKPIMLNEQMALLIKPIRADSGGYYNHFYGIDARYESDKQITLEPNSKTLLARPFYWDQNDPSDDKRIEQGKRKMRMTLSAGSYSWNADTWFEVR